MSDPSSASLAARLPWSFQLPTTSFDRIATLKPQDFIAKRTFPSGDGTLRGRAHGRRDRLGELLDVGTLLALDHDPHDGLGTGRAQQHPPAARELAFGPPHRLAHARPIEVELPCELNAASHLRQARPVC